MSEPLLHGLRWQDIPGHPPKRAAAILGVSVSKIYGLLGDGQLEAVKRCGKTIVSTESIVTVAETSEPWQPDRERVERAIAGRRDVREHRKAEAARVSVKSKTMRKAPQAPRASPKVKARAPK